MVYNEVDMKVEITEEFVSAVTRSVKQWQRETVPDEEKDQHYDVFCEEEHGLKIKFASVDNKVCMLGAEIIDEEKYINFLLRFGNMHYD